ncbi:MAG: DinB family protein [Bryobacteraceae bacterium]|jgi:uncharacterized damage-inducible protein DinB
MFRKIHYLFLIPAASAHAVYAQANPLSSELRGNYTTVRNNILRGAEKMPELDYNFKPASGSRTFGEVVTHIAVIQAALRAIAKGEAKQLDESKKTKADAIATLKAAFDYCDPIYDALTDASGLQMAKMFGRDRTRFGILDFAVSHDNEMYGTMAVYLRARGVVPPSSEPVVNTRKPIRESSSFIVILRDSPPAREALA